MATRTAQRKRAVPGNTREHAWKIAEAVDDAWHSHFGGSRIEIPISVVAALSLVEQGDRDGPDLAEQMLRLDRHGFAELLRGIWTRFAIIRPDLLPRTKPLWEWLDDDPLDDQLLRSVYASGQVALSHGQLELTGVERRRHEIDLLGAVLQTVRSRSSRRGLGQFLTPVDVADAIGQVLFTASAPTDSGDGEDLTGALVTPHEGSTVLEPCSGTGTMLLSAAKAMRQNGDNPAKVEWWANDIDWLAAACCAVNLHCWGLGVRVVVGCGDGLVHDWMRQALDERQKAIDEIAGLWEKARMLAAVRQLLGLEPPEDPLVRHLREAQSPPAARNEVPPHSSTFDADPAYLQGWLF